MKSKVLKISYILTLLFSLLLAACTDDFPYRDVEIPEGEGILSATVTFTPTTASELGTTRTDGDALNSINSLWVLVYDKQKNLVTKYAKSDLLNYDDTQEYTVDQDKDHLDGNEAHTDEKKTARATFQIPNLPYGQYYIFAVANMDNLSDYEEAIQTVEGLQHISLTWDTSDISKNSQMFGYFTSGSSDSEGFEPKEPITFAGRTTESKIHAWLKRAASKVTVAFDPSGLNQGVSIYIKSVTVMDIPKTCLLGAVNTPKSVAELDNHLAEYGDPDYKNQFQAVANSRLEYNSKGVITDSNEQMGENATDGLRLDNSILNAIPENAHATNAPSLFFYENNQTPYLEEKDANYKSKTEYDKRPQKDGDDKIGNTIHKPENNNDFKDRVPYGTYVEVVAYYVSSNPANPGEGSIKYRFMLGKDVSFDYNAERNYHYKLTLGFKGWANDPDWHIDYVVTPPAIEVPSVFRVSYLYQQKSELPIKIVGDIEWLTVTITENNWAPYDPNPDTNQVITQGGKEYLVPKQTISTSPSTYEFKWNEQAFRNSAYLNPTSTPNGAYPANLPTGQQRPQFGFLALHLPSRDLTTIKIEDLGGNGYGSTYNDKLIEYWNAHQEGIRRFGSNSNKGGDDFEIRDDHTQSHNDLGENLADNGYKVKPVLNDNNEPISNQRILMLPVWTRTKSLAGIAGFSGNNPYEAFERKATLHITARFKGDDNPIEKDVEVYQVKRITNPKGVWRAHDRTETFNVTLLEAVNSNGESDFQPFISQGEWTAYIEQQTNDGGFSIRPNGETNGYMKDGKIYGNTGSEIHFAINFGNPVAEDQSECAIVKVEYHGNQCLHKILVRKGYNAPLRMGGTTPTNGKLWSSFSLYQATSAGRTEEGRDVYNAVLTKNPLMLGSMFRRGKQDQGIFVWNNVPENTGLGPFVAPNGASFVVGQNMNSSITNPTDPTQFKAKWNSRTWAQIDYRNDIDAAGRANNMGIYYAEDENGITRKYRVPTFTEFRDLTDNSEFGFGVFYGSFATEPKLTAQEAYGLIDPYNEGLFTNPNGMRAVVAYDKLTGNQILFPIGRYGIGTRRMFNVPKIAGTNNGNPIYFGILHYSDVYAPLTGANDLYRPIPYNLPIVSGCIYWIDQYVAANTYGNPYSCLGWDMNYFNFDFNNYTENNYQDACPIKFVIDE